MQTLVFIICLTLVLLASALILRRWYRTLHQIRQDEWRRVPNPEWRAKRGGMEIW